MYTSECMYLEVYIICVPSTGFEIIFVRWKTPTKCGMRIGVSLSGFGCELPILVLSREQNNEAVILDDGTYLYYKSSQLVTSLNNRGLLDHSLSNCITLPYTQLSVCVPIDVHLHIHCISMRHIYLGISISTCIY